MNNYDPIKHIDLLNDIAKHEHNLHLANTVLENMRVCNEDVDKRLKMEKVIKRINDKIFLLELELNRIL